MKNPNEYTDEEIYESLKLKIEKLGIDNQNHALMERDGEWISIGKFISNKELVKLVSTIYKSGYLRAQKGRSFIIEEKKEEKSKPNLEYRDGALVRYLGCDAQEPYIGEYYPNVGTIGKVIQYNLIDWGEDSNTEEGHRWFCERECLEVIG